MKKKSFSYYIYRFIKFCVWLFYPHILVEGEEQLPSQPCVIVGNHSKMNGPIALELYSPRKHFTWCTSEMMHLKEVPAYAYHDFWEEKPKWIRWFYRLLSYIIAPLSVCIFCNADTIAVYKDARVLGTFKDSILKLSQGADLVIFPEHDAPYNHILCDFQDRFVDVARLYYRKTGQELEFVPLYLAPQLKKMYFGKGIRFDASQPIAAERERICTYLKEEITKMAVSLPVHTVIPYKNIPRREYLKNISQEQDVNDKPERGNNEKKKS